MIGDRENSVESTRIEIAEMIAALAADTARKMQREGFGVNELLEDLVTRMAELAEGLEPGSTSLFPELLAARDRTPEYPIEEGQ